MIAVSDTLHPELRDRSLLDLTNDDLRHYGLRLEKERDRFYIVLSFACNAQCAYCLFRFERIRDCSAAKLSDAVRRVFRTYPETNFSVSITGGEPFLRPRRTRAVLEAIRETANPANTRWIGFGTNGTGKVPTYLNDYADYTFDLYVSRHHYATDRLVEIFGTSDLLPLEAFTTELGAHVRVKVSCNLIREGIDSLAEVKRLLDWAAKTGVRQVTFRELNKVVGESSMYREGYVLDYIRYYDAYRVALADLLPLVEADPDFRFLGQDVRPFIYHERWQYGSVAVTFRRIDEARLLEYNAGFSGVDEIVIHPDGLITGCWDREQKILNL